MMNSETKQYDYETKVDEQLKNFISSAIAVNELDESKFKNYVNDVFKSNPNVTNISAFIYQDLKKVDLTKFKKKKVTLLLHEFENIPFKNFEGTREEKYLVIKLFEYGINELGMSGATIRDFSNAIGERCIKTNRKNWATVIELILRSKSYAASNIQVDELKAKVSKELADWDALFPTTDKPDIELEDNGLPF